MKNLKLEWVLWIFLILSAIIWFAIAQIQDLDLTTFKDFIRPIPDVVTFDLILSFLFVKWGWRWKYFQGWLVPFPDLTGTWLGTIQSEWRTEDGSRLDPIPAVLTINQTFSHISCVLRTSEMESHSYVEGFYIDKDRQIRKLCYSYTSTPKITLRERSTPHDGTALFSIIGKPVERLEGEYWTQRQTIGSINMKYKSRDIIDSLPVSSQQHPMDKNSKN